MVIYMSGSTPYNDVEVMYSEQSAGSICMEGAVRTEAAASDAEAVKGMLLVFVVSVRCHCLTSLRAGRQVISSPFAHYSSTGGLFWLACLGKLQKNIFTAHTWLLSFRSG